MVNKSEMDFIVGRAKAYKEMVDEVYKTVNNKEMSWEMVKTAIEESSAIDLGISIEGLQSKISGLSDSLTYSFEDLTSNLVEIRNTLSGVESELENIGGK